LEKSVEGIGGSWQDILFIQESQAVPLAPGVPRCPLEECSAMSMFRSFLARHLLLAILASLSVMPLAAQEEFYTPLAINKEAVKSFKHDYISVIHGPGQIRFQMPIGPGIGCRGLHFKPEMLVHPTQKTTSGLSGTAGWQWQIYGFDRYMVGSTDPALNANTIWYNCVESPTTSLQGIGNAPDNFLANTFDHDGTGPRQLDMGYLIHSDVTGDIISLPDGSVTRTFVSGTSINAPFGDLFKVSAATYQQALAQFGYTDLSSSFQASKTSNGGILIPLHSATGDDTISSVGNDAFPVKGAYRYVLMLNDVAYEYNYYCTNSTIYHPPQYIEGDIAVAPTWGVLDLMYRLDKISNRYGDSIRFVYGSNDFDYSAELFVDGSATGEKINVVMSDIANANQGTGTTPNLGSPNRLNFPNYLPVDKNITITTSGLNGVQSSYVINAALTTDGTDINEYIQRYAIKRCRIQPVKILEQSTNLEVDLSYAWVQGYLPYAEGLTVSSVVISNITFSNKDSFDFTYSAAQYHSSVIAYGSDWEPMAWGVSAIKRTDKTSNISQTTSYWREVPIAPSILSAGCGNPRNWLTTNFYEAEQFPDGKTKLRKFYPPSTSAPVSSTLFLSSDQIAKLNLYCTGQLYEERTYAQYADWYSGVTSNNTSMLDLKFYDEWDAREFSWDPSIPLGTAFVSANGSDGPVSQVAVIPLRAMRTTTWNASTGIAEVTRQRNWDPNSAQWGQEDKIHVQVTGSPWTALGLDYTKYSDATTGTTNSMPTVSGQIVRSTVTAWQPLDGYFVIGDWTQRDYLQDGAARLPSAYRTSLPENGLPKSEETRGTDGAKVRKEYTYQTETIGVPSSVVLASDGLFGLDKKVGVNLGYDALYRTNSVQKLGFSYNATRQLTPEGYVSQIVDINQLTTNYTWDSLGRLTSATPPAPELATSITYHTDFLGMTLARGVQEQQYRFNAFGDLIREIRKSADNAYSYRKTGYDPGGRKIWQTVWQSGQGDDSGWDGAPPSGAHVTTWTYDDYDRVTQEVNPLGEAVTSSYAGLTKTVTVGAGTSSANATSFTSDVLGRLLTVTDAMQNVTIYTHDTGDRILKVDQAGPGPTTDSGGSPSSFSRRAARPAIPISM
jgi:hypothetical protein